MTYAMTLLCGVAPMVTMNAVTPRVKSRAGHGVLDWPPTPTGGGSHEAQGAHGARHRRLPRHRSSDCDVARRGRRRRRDQLRLERDGRQGGDRADSETGPSLD